MTATPLRDELGIDVVAVRKYTTPRGKARFSLLLADGREVLVGSAKDLLSQQRFRVAVAVGARWVTPWMSRRDWHAVCRALVQRIVDVPPGKKEGGNRDAARRE